MTTNPHPPMSPSPQQEVRQSTPLPPCTDLTDEEAQVAWEEAYYAAPTPETHALHLCNRDELYAFCLAGLRSSPAEIAGLVPADRALVAAFREMPLLADLLLEAIHARYAAYAAQRVVRGRADKDLLIAIHGHRGASGMTLRWADTPEARALFEHADFDHEIDALPEAERSEIRRFQATWRQEQQAYHAALRGDPPLAAVTDPVTADGNASAPDGAGSGPIGIDH
jgi:hypothetical protein